MTTAPRFVRILAAVLATAPCGALGQGLPAEVERLVSAAKLPDARVGVCVIDADTRRVLVERDAAGGYMPASNLKLLTSGAALPKTDFTASLVSGSSRHFLVYDNYDALLEYNCAHSYAISVALLSERIQ